VRTVRRLRRPRGIGCETRLAGAIFNPQVDHFSALTAHRRRRVRKNAYSGPAARVVELAGSAFRNTANKHLSTLMGSARRCCHPHGRVHGGTI